MRGTTPEQEERKIRSEEPLSGFWRYADDLSTGGAEVVFLSLPGTVALLNIGYEIMSVIFAIYITIIVLTVGVTAGGSNWVSFGPPWPEWGIKTLIFRVGYYSLAMVVMGLTGGYVDATAGGEPAIGVITALGLVFVVALPRSYLWTVKLLQRLLDYHRWLFPRQNRY